MTALRSRAAGPLLSITLLGLGLMAAGCSVSATATTRPGASGAPSSPAASPQPTAVPAGGSAGTGPSVAPAATTKTAFGMIFDSLPPHFPKLPGQEPGGTTSGPTSGSFVANTTVRAAVGAIRAALTAAGWSVDVGSPLEDGSVVLEANHAPAGCRTEVRFTPLSGTVSMSVLYGASCPFG